MGSDESLNQSAFLNSFSAYSDHDASAHTNIDIVNNSYVYKNYNDSPMTAAMTKLMNHKVDHKIPFSKYANCMILKFLLLFIDIHNIPFFVNSLAIWRMIIEIYA